VQVRSLITVYSQGGEVSYFTTVSVSGTLLFKDWSVDLSAIENSKFKIQNSKYGMLNVEY